MSKFAVAPLAKGLPFGAVITELRMDDLKDQDTRKELYDLWIQSGVMVFKGWEGEEAQLELSRCFGKPVQHPAREARGAEHPELMNVHYEPDTGWLLNVDGELRGNWLPWHKDLIYVDRINHGGILRPLILPKHLGHTGFIDQIAAYSSLPDELKVKIEELSVIYKYDLDPGNQKFGRTAIVKVERFTPGVNSVQSRLDDFPRAIHPMVYTQEQTGRKVLNVSPWFAVAIHGMENDAGDSLLEEVAQHIVHNEHVYVHEWHIDEMVLWDNWRMLHSAPGSPADEERWMLRTTIEGDYGRGRSEANAVLDRAGYISV
jgi:taurine dioxygenase